MTAAIQIVPDTDIPDRACRRDQHRHLRLVIPTVIPTVTPTAPVGTGTRAVGASVRVRPPDPSVVTVLHRPSERSISAPLRLTRRGVAAIAAAVAVLGAALVVLAWVSAPAGGGAGATDRPAPARVVVRDGDTLWSIAGRVAPGADPLAEIDRLSQVNHLRGAALIPGQILRTR